MSYDVHDMTTNVAPYRATNLKEVLTLQGRSLRWMAERCGVSRSHFSRICSGEKRASAHVVQVCSDILGVPVELLFERDA